MKLNPFFAFWLKNLRTSFLLIILIIVVWIFSLYQIPKESSPDIKFGIINVTIVYPGVNPEDMDSLITEKVEWELDDLDGIKKISSISGVWMSSVTIELETGVNTRNLLIDIKDKIDNLSLPEDSLEPTINEISSNNTLIYEALIYWDQDKFDDFSLMQKAKRIKDKLEWSNWISSIDIWWIDSLKFWASWWGVSDYEIKVLLYKNKVELLGLSIIEISNIIKSENKDTPIWNYKVGNLSYDFRFEWELNSINELKNIVIKDSGSSQIKLNEIAEFKREYSWDEIKRLGFYNKTGKNYISLIFNKSTWANVFEASKNSKKALKILLKDNDEFEWLSVEYSKDMSEQIVEDYWNLWNTALTTIILVFITILFFVGFREWLIATLLIPLAFMITFIVLDTIWLSMNFLTNFSLVLTLWIAIDTVIVIIEWASEKMRLWYSRESSIMLAVRDFKSPLISWTSTTLVAFLPLMFLPGVMWKFLSYIPITVFVTLVASLFLSLTLASALFVKLMKSKKDYHKENDLEKNMVFEDTELLRLDRLNKIEKKGEKLSLRERFLIFLWKYYEEKMKNIFSSTLYKILFTILPFILLILSFLFISPKIGFTIFPQTDEWVINISITWETGSKEDSMKKYISDIDNILSVTPEIKVYYIKVSWNQISVYVDLIDKNIRNKKDLLSSINLGKVLEEKLSYLKSEGLGLTVAALKWWPPWGSAVWIKLSVNTSKNFDLLKSVSEDFEKHLSWIEWAKNIFTSSSDAPWQFIFEFNKEKLSNIWLRQNDILNELYFYTNWIKSGSIKSWLEDNDVIVSFKEFENNLNPEDISNLIITTKAWKIRVWDFAAFEFKKSVNNISREDSNIIIEVGSEVKDWLLPTDIQPKLDEFAKNYDYPDWIKYINWWEWEENKDLIVSTIKSLFIAIFLIFSILVFQFNSFRQPAIVLYSIILALLWVNVWLYLTWNPYSMPFMIGFIALTWIVVNDAIILIDRINKGIINAELSSDKINYIEQIIIAWKTRLQPIIVTTLTTIFWILPLALQDEFWAWLGFTIIFWLFVWSFMTLVVIPILYYYLVLSKKVKNQKK
jgi:multidrug efflux pump subunit AcrB